MESSLPKVKVACIGNMNNMMFTLCRYLRDKGVDAHLFTFSDEAEHFLPEADCYDDSYKNYTINLPVGKNNIYHTTAGKEILPYLEGFDFFIGTDIAPALLTLIGKKTDIFIPHGSDIYAYPFPESPKQHVDKIWWLQEPYFIGHLQKTGIKNARTIIFPDEYDLHFPFKNKLKITGKFVNTSGPMVYVPQYGSTDVESSFHHLKSYPFFKKLREKSGMIVFSHARQNGSDLPAEHKVHDKGNEKLIRGFAKFILKSGDVHPCLVLFEYGMDVEHAQKLVLDLQIQDNVVWMGKMQRKEIMFGLMNADVCCGEFANSWLTCGVVNETLALGKPLLHYREDELYKKEYQELYPILNAHTEDEIYNQLMFFCENRQVISEKSKGGQGWLEKHTVEQPLGLVLKQISETKSFSQNIPVSDRCKVWWLKLKLSLLITRVKITEKTVYRARYTHE